MANLPGWMSLPAPDTEVKPMWLTCDHASFLSLQVGKCDSIYVVRKGSGNWAIVGTIGDRDILIKGGIGCERDAVEMAQTIVNGI